MTGPRTRAPNSAPLAEGTERLAAAVARHEALGSLALGAAHTLNNAFTAVLGEASFLIDERKGDPLVVEACQLIQEEIERCARLTRALLARRRSAGGSSLQAIDLAQLVRSAAPLLRDTISRSVEVEFRLPDRAVPVHGRREDLELLILLLAHRLVGREARGGELGLRLEDPGEGAVVLALERLAPGAADVGPLEPLDDWDARVLEAVAELCEDTGAGLEARGAGERSALSLRLPRAPL
jgi:hypothetical protein